VVLPTTNPNGMGLCTEKAIEFKISITAKAANPIMVFFIFYLPSMVYLLSALGATASQSM
jgi:hypothetical protein